MRQLMVLLLLVPAVLFAEQKSEILATDETTVHTRARYRCAILRPGRYYVTGRKRRNRLSFANGYLLHSCKLAPKYFYGYFGGIFEEDTQMCLGDKLDLYIRSRDKTRRCRIRRIIVR